MIILKLNYFLGPANWRLEFPPAGGIEQSPIDINSDAAEFDASLVANPLSFTYDENCFKFVENTGSSFNVTGTSNANSSKV